LRFAAAGTEQQEGTRERATNENTRAEEYEFTGPWTNPGPYTLKLGSYVLHPHNLKCQPI